MSISYFHRITAIGTPPSIKEYKDTYQERLRSSIINHFASYAVENESCDIVSIDADHHISSMEIVGDNLLYYKYGMISPESFDKEFVNEIMVKCDSDTKYTFDLHTHNRSLRDEIYMLSLCFPSLTLQCRSWNDTEAYGNIYYVIKAGEMLDWIHTHHIPKTEDDADGLPVVIERDYSPSKPKRHLAIRIYGADGELIIEL